MRLLARLTSLALILLALHVVGVVEIRWPHAARSLANEARERTGEWIRAELPVRFLEALPVPAGSGAEAPDDGDEA